VMFTFHLLYYHVAPCDLHSFPTRRSSDLGAVGAIGCSIGKGIRAKSAQFGYWLGEPYWGRGIMSAAVQRIAPYVLTRYELVRLRSEEHTSELQSLRHLVCRLLLEKKKKKH